MSMTHHAALSFLNTLVSVEITDGDIDQDRVSEDWVSESNVSAVTAGGVGPAARSNSQE
ncbi:hypothetical protein HZS55_19045 [Halosimplex rubrum]|uniref:Uncharacterized protein n=1 Tax=Halosimplex rubrum TaxID=869889 RepID=A0A7D5P4Z1_9EURY|nr:hypothetical protein [Halosimplex rubrum]QLH79261.1 hypothetical protein HZS55_19045 [Halosimplex rubrum]